MQSKGYLLLQSLSIIHICEAWMMGSPFTSVRSDSIASSSSAVIRQMVWSPTDEDENNNNSNSNSNNALKAMVENKFFTSSAGGGGGGLGDLASLAVAFSPASTKIRLQDIEHVSIIKVDREHIELEAVVCEDDGCLTIFVPLSYPKNCDGVQESETEECVLENLNELNKSASDTIQNILDAAEKEGSDEYNAMNEDRSIDSKRVIDIAFSEEEGPITYPEWWWEPQYHQNELRTECDTLKRVLNEDGFQEEIVALANVGLEQQISSMKAEGTSINSTYYIHKAVVKEVGLSGIVFRVKAANTSNSALENQIISFDVPFMFQDAVTGNGKANDMDADESRQAVLNAISSVSIDEYSEV